jgi:hypothetical protein
MEKDSDKDALLREISAVLRQYGIEPKAGAQSVPPPAALRRAEEIAQNIVGGHFNLAHISELDAEVAALIPNLVERLVSLRGVPGVRALQERNPYYTAFGSQIIRDSEEEE